MCSEPLVEVTYTIWGVVCDWGPVPSVYDLCWFGQTLLILFHETPKYRYRSLEQNDSKDRTPFVIINKALIFCRTVHATIDNYHRIAVQDVNRIFFFFFRITNIILSLLSSCFNDMYLYLVTTLYPVNQILMLMNSMCSYHSIRVLGCISTF